MSGPKQPTYAANSKQMARALGLKATRAQLEEIGRWRKRPDFPKKQRRGFIGTELCEWYRQFLDEAASTPALFDPAKVQELAERAVINQWSAGKLVLEKLRPSQRAVLLKHGIIAGDSGFDEEVSNLGFATNQEGLTEALARHFGQKFGFTISADLVSRWLRGKAIPRGRPPPPTKLRGRFNVQRFAEWVGECHSESKQIELIDANQRMETAKLSQAEYDAGLARLKFESEAREHDGHWLKLEEQIRLVQAATVVLKQAVRNGNEREDVAALREQCRALNVSAEITAALCAGVLERGIARQTAFERAIAEWGAEIGKAEAGSENGSGNGNGQARPSNQ